MKDRNTMPPSIPPSRALAQRRVLLTLGAAGLAGLGACASPVARPGVGEPAAPQPLVEGAADQVAPFSAGAGTELPSGWQPYVLRTDRAITRYRLARDGQRQVLHAAAASSASGLRCPVDIDPHRQKVLRFSWRVPQVPTQATVEDQELDDSPARIVVAFEGDNARLSLRERLLFDQVELFTGHRLPYATLMYVWDGHQAPGTVTANHRTSRIRYLTVEGGAARAGQWLSYQRDVVADFQRVFGEAPGAISSVGVLTDSDRLKLDLEAWYGDISLSAV